MNKTTFDDWYARLREAAALIGWNVSEKPLWRDLYEKGHTPEEALKIDARYED